MTTHKFLLIGPALDGGGAESRFRKVALNLLPGQVEIALLHGRKPQTDKEPEYLDLKYRGKLSYLRAAWILRRQLQKKNYAQIMCFGLFPSFVGALALIYLHPRPGFIVHEITRPLAEAKMHSFLKSTIYSGVRKWIYRKATTLTANSIDGSQEVCKINGVSTTRCIRLPNIIDHQKILEQAESTPLVPIPTEGYVISVGRLDEMKGIETIIEAMEQIQQTSKLGLLIIGDGPHRKVLEAFVQEKNLEQRVQMTGAIGQPIPLLKGALAFVLASEFEGFSNAVLEAMFCDIPVVTSFCSSDAKQMCAKGAALGFVPGDAHRLAQHLKELENSPLVRRQLVEKARVYRAPHEVHTALPCYEDLFTGEKHCISAN